VLTNEEKRIKREWQELFDSPGWGRFRAQLQEELDNLPTVAFYNAKTLDELVAYRVRARLLGEFIAFEDIIKRQEEELLMTREQERMDREETDALRNL
jgi:hypothetical protein